MQTKQCLTEQELADFDLGNLAAEKFEEASQHLDFCGLCAGRFERLDQQPDAVAASLRLKLSAEIVGEDSELHRLVDAATALVDTSLNGLAETRDGEGRRKKPPLAHSVAQVLSPAQAPDELGRLGGYRVLAVLGVGGMGVVFKAEDVGLRRMVALKAMLPHLAGASSSARARFVREAQATAAIQHDNIVTIHQVGQDGDVPFLAMQLLDGESLAARLQREGPLSCQDMCRIAREAAQGLVAAHGKGLTHRDIKPDNIWLEGKVEGLGSMVEGKYIRTPAFNSEPSTLNKTRVKILDFGLARAADDHSDLTQAGAVVGTPSYLAPEQAMGQAVDARSDLFSLGVVMYQILTGKKPFQRDSVLATLRAIDTETPPAPDSVRADISPALSDLVMRLLEKEPSERYESAAALVDAIREIEVESSRPVALPETRKTRPRNVTPRHRVFIAMATMALFVLFAAAVITIRDKNGNIVAKFFGDYSVDVQFDPRNANQSTIPLAHTESSHVSDAVAAESTEHLPTISPLALVQRPAKLKAQDGEAVLSWTIAPRNLIAPDGIIPALRPDGKFVAAFGDDGYVRVWNIERTQLTQVLVGHAAGPALASDAPNSHYSRTNSRRFGPVVWQGNTSLLATASCDGSLRVWDVESGKTVFQQDGPADSINMLAWSPDGSQLAAAYTGDGSIRCWNAGDWKELKPLDPLRRIPRCIVWAPDSKTLAVTTDQGAFLWTPADGKKRDMPEMPLTNGSYFGYAAVRWAPDGDRLAFRHGNTLTICDAESLQPDKRLTLAGQPTTAPYDFAWSPDGRQILVGWIRDGKQERHIHDVLTGEIIQSFEDETYDHFASIEWLPDGRRVMIGNRLVDLEAKRILQGRFNILWEASADGTLVLSTEIHGVPCVSSLGADGAEAELVFDAGHISTVSTTVLPGGRSMSIAANSSLEQLDWTDLPSEQGYQHQSMSIVSWSPDEKYMLSGSPNNRSGEIRSWPDGKAMHSLEVFPVTASAWSRDGSRLAVAGGDRTLRKIDVATGTTSGPWNDPAGVENYINAIAWSEDGSRIVVGGNRVVGILSALDGSLKVKLEPQMGAGRLCWTPNDSHILCVGNDEVLVYDPQTGNITRRITASVTPLSFSGWPAVLPIHFIDNQTFYFVSAAGEFSELNVATGKTKALRKIPCEAAQFSPDGDYVFGDQGRVRRIWRTSDAELIVSFVTGEILASPEGHVWTKYNASGPRWPTSQGIGETLVYVVQTASGQQTLTPLEFANRYGWQNDPSKVRLSRRGNF